jgi:transposase
MIELTKQGYRLLEEKGKEEVEMVVEFKDRPGSCPYCEGVRLRSKGRYCRKVRHLPCVGLPCYLVIHCQRYRCADCQRSFVPELPGVMPGRRSSEALRRNIYQWHEEGVCVATLASREGLGQATVSRIYAEHTERKARERITLNCPQVLGIDEHTLHKQQRFATTLCDLKNHKIFDVVEGRSGFALARYFCRLKGREKVRVVCMDLSSSYRAIVRRWFPNALIVADRFHVIRIVQHHLLKLGRQFVPQLSANRPWLNLLRSRRDRLDPERKAQLEVLLDSQPLLRPLFEMKEDLCSLLRISRQNKRECRPLVNQLLYLIESLKRSGFQEAQSLGLTLQNWSQEIARMWRFSRNNGITEGFHRKMKLIQRRAYGFRNFNNYRLRVIAQCG